MSSKKQILIIQTSPPRTASTLLVNALYGIINELKDKNILGTWSKDWKSTHTSIIVLKCHNINIDSLIKEYGNKYHLYFVCSERPILKKVINQKYKKYPNVISFYYRDLLETPSNTLTKITDNIYNRVSNLLSKHKNITLNKQNGLNRIIEMNKKYIEIKDKPFDYVDPFFEIHGSHRDRKD